MSTEVATYLKYASLQMAAEALYDRKTALAGDRFSGAIDPRVLTQGNERSSKFTQVQADEFSQNWTVAEHISNTSTGFSGTLFRNNQTGEQVLSFRSTEFADDAARDNQATNVMEIKAEGWAFGQIADMESWFASLKASGKVDPGVPISVTGYSLGGHLATAFNLLHQNEFTSFGALLISGTYTFNGAGAGVGTVAAGHSLIGVVNDFTAHCNGAGNADLSADAGVRRASLAIDGGLEHSQSRSHNHA